MSLLKKPRLALAFMSMSNALLQNALENTRISAVFPSGMDTVIGTHDGSFHCDEALAISMLKILPQFKDSPILRTRKPELLAQCSIVVDVGAEYLPDSFRFDHHQREFTGTLDGWKTKLSSAGLIYKHFGKQIIGEILSKCEIGEVTEGFVDICYRKVYEGFMEHIG